VGDATAVALTDERRTKLIFSPVTNVVAGGVVVSTVHLSYLRAVEVHRDRRALARVLYHPVNAPGARQYGRGLVLR
jgi:hypothetical protein